LTTGTRNETARIAGLDTIRFGAALLVAMSHGMLIPRRIYLDGGSPLEFWSGAIGHMLADGPAAVAVFFVLSGLCIHLSRDAVERNPLQFLVRRMIRIGIPVLAIIVAAELAGQDAPDLERGILWSVYCEISYYLTYPLLLIARRRWSLGSILCFSTMTSIAIVMLLPAETRMWEYGWGAAAICYPLWIMGAMLAEHTPRIAPRRTEYLWLRRAVMVFAGACCAAVRHFEWATYLPMISYAVTGALGVPFLRAEIAHARAVRPPALGEGLGQASYSLYLSHIVPLTFAERALSAVSQWVAGPLELATVSVSTLVFYILCERPALLLARSISITPGQWNSLSAMRRKRTLAPAAWSKTPEPPAC
jgi:peptidoglycan/LPS O-acetylase OafA/YrhL